MVTTRSASYIYAGILLPVKLSRLIGLQGVVGAGYYQPGEDMNLYYGLEFNLMAEVSFSLKNGYRLGLKWAHLSNGGLGYRNPGTERITIGLKIPY